MRTNGRLGAMLLVLTSGLAAGQVREEWVARYDGPRNHADAAAAISLDARGHVYVTGRTCSFVVEGFCTAYDYATIQYDAAGNPRWVARFGESTRTELAKAIVVDAAGNVYVTGQIVDRVTRWSDYATIKYDADGNELWVARYNGPANRDDIPSGIAVDAHGNVYVTGSSVGTGRDHDYATVKYDADGNELWVARYNGPANHEDLASGIALDTQGNVYVTGQSCGFGHFPNCFDYASVKYDPEGGELWVVRYDGPGNQVDGATAIALDAAGHVYVTGFSHGSARTSLDYATIQYDADGNELWVARYNGPGNSDDLASAIALDPEGNVAVTGRSWNGSSSLDDYATVKYDAQGNELWAALFNGPGNDTDRPAAIAADAEGNVYVTGSSWAGPSANFDYATIKYDPDGKEVWVVRYNGPVSSQDQAVGVAVDAAGNVYVTGSSVGDRTNTDYATIRYAQK